MREDPQVIRKEADAVLRHEFGLAPPTSKLFVHDTASWEALKKKRQYKEKPTSQLAGWYFTKEQEAHVWSAHPDWISTIYHELHGHGLFYERSRMSAICTTTQDDDPIDANGWGIPVTRWHNSEGFATWMEGYLCRATGRHHILRAVERCWPASYRDAYERANAAAKELSPAGFLRQMGIPVAIDKDRAADIVRAASANRRVELALLVDTSGPTDPVRVIVVSDDRPSIREQPWLKPRVMEGERFITEVVARDATLTAQIKNAQLLYGDSWAFEKAKARLVNGTLPS